MVVKICSISSLVFITYLIAYQSGQLSQQAGYMQGYSDGMERCKGVVK